MAELFQKRKITHVLKISAQSEQLQQRYCRFYWFLKSACLRYVSTWGRDCVSGVLPCLVHSQNLSKLIGHSDDGQKPNRTAVRSYCSFDAVPFPSYPLSPAKSVCPCGAASGTLAKIRTAALARPLARAAQSSRYDFRLFAEEVRTPRSFVASG